MRSRHEASDALEVIEEPPSASLDLFTHFIEQVGDFAMLLDVQAQVLWASQSLCALTGAERHKSDLAALFSLSSLELIKEAIEQLSTSSQPLSLVCTLMTRQAPAPVSIRFFRAQAKGQVWGVGTQLTALPDFTQQLLHQSLHDELTGLPNRKYFRMLVEQYFTGSKMLDNFAFAVLDVDGFKAVNEAMGHQKGDHLLQQVACRLRGVLRANDLVARTGGDEFSIVLTGPADRAEAQRILREAIRAIRQPVDIDGLSVQVSASAGVSFYPEQGSQYDCLHRKADQAVHLAKQEGKNRCVLFSNTIAHTLGAQLTMEAAMRRGLANGEFYMVYQPLLTNQGKLLGCEALMRWTRADGTSVPPSEFIPVAEDSELIEELGAFAIESALANLCWMDQRGLRGLYVSVNVSPKQLSLPGFDTWLQETLNRYEVAPRRLVLELTESCLMCEPTRINELLHAIVKTGVRLSLDDFGTGYSCLSYLKTYPISVLKVDKSFICDITDSKVDRAIVRTVVELAHALKLVTVAEGIETAEQVATLKALNVDYFQGYHFGKPMPPVEFISRFSPS